MQKWSGDLVFPPLELIFKFCLESGMFLSERKKSKNYCPISLLPAFEWLIYNKIFEYFIEHDLISHNQSAFKRGDSCINQLLSITHEISKSFDEGYESRGVFLNILKAFDKFWHEGILRKLMENGISAKLLNTVTEFSYQQKQRIVLNAKTLHGLQLKQGFYKVLYLDFCFF